MFRARPFRHTFPDDLKNPPLICEGKIQDCAFTILIGVSAITIPTVEIGSDEWGEFAVIDEWEHVSESGFIIRVQPELDEIDPQNPRFGCEISFLRPAALPPLIKESVDRRGMTVDDVKMIIPPDSNFGLSFGYAGHLNGGYRMESRRGAATAGGEMVQ